LFLELGLKVDARANGGKKDSIAVSCPKIAML
jgi:hypothetical protein